MGRPKGKKDSKPRKKKSFQGETIKVPKGSKIEAVEPLTPPSDGEAMEFTAETPAACAAGVSSEKTPEQIQKEEELKEIANKLGSEAYAIFMNAAIEYGLKSNVRVEPEKLICRNELGYLWIRYSIQMGEEGKALLAVGLQTAAILNEVRLEKKAKRESAQQFNPGDQVA